MFNLKTSKPSKWQEAFCISAAISVATVIYLKFNIYDGCWIPMTVGLMFLAVDQGQGAIILKTKDRAIGTVIGLLFAFFFVEIMMYQSYLWGYFLPVILFVGTYLFYASSNYAFWTMTITILVAICMSITIPVEFSLIAILIIRLICTYTGIVIAVLSEYLFFKNAASAKPKIEAQINSYFISQGEIVILATKKYLNAEIENSMFDEVLTEKIWKHISNMSNIEQGFSGLKYEFDYELKSGEYYSKFFITRSKVSILSRKILSISGHEKITKDESLNEKLLKFAENVSELYRTGLLNVANIKDSKSSINAFYNELKNSLIPFSAPYYFVRTLKELCDVYFEYRLNA